MIKISLHKTEPTFEPKILHIEFQTEEDLKIYIAFLAELGLADIKTVINRSLPGGYLKSLGTLNTSKKIYMGLTTIFNQLLNHNIE